MSQPENQEGNVPSTRASSAIGAALTSGIKYGLLAVVVYYVFKWLGWVG